MKDNKKFNLYIVVLISLSVVCFTPSFLAAVEKATEQRSHLKELELRLQRLLGKTDYHYDARGKPDPFRPFLQTSLKQKQIKRQKRTPLDQKVSNKTCESPLECMDVGQLSLVGIVEVNGKGSIAMAQDSAGIGYIIRVGDNIGFNQGRVTAILHDRVIVTEQIEDIQGNIVPRKRVLLLHPEEE